MMPDCEFDSFLTIGLDGPALIPGTLSTVGLELSGWDESTGLNSDNGAVFFMDPMHGATTEPVVFTQLTVRAGSQFNRGAMLASVPASPHLEEGDDEDEDEDEGAAPAAPAAPARPPPSRAELKALVKDALVETWGDNCRSEPGGAITHQIACRSDGRRAGTLRNRAASEARGRGAPPPGPPELASLPTKVIEEDGPSLVDCRMHGGCMVIVWWC